MKQKNVISSPANPQVKNLALLLKKPRAREEQDAFIIEGLKMYEEARDLALLIKVYISESFYQNMFSQKPDYFNAVDYEILTDSVFKAVSETATPQGIMAIVKRNSYKPEAILSNPNALLLLLEDIRDPGNLGTMIRTAEGAGVTGIITNDTTVDVYNSKVVRATMGSVFRVPVCQVDNFYDILSSVKQHKISIYAAHLTGSDYYDQEGYNDKCAFLIGNEANGLSEQASRLADRLIKIPMAGKVESLNAAVAAAVLMYEAARQRRVSR
jgi:TrmH family RNA methyltransferase